MALNAPYLPPNPLRPRAFGGKGAEGMKKEIPSNNNHAKPKPKATAPKVSDEELFDQLFGTDSDRLQNARSLVDAHRAAHPGLSLQELAKDPALTAKLQGLMQEMMTEPELCKQFVEAMQLAMKVKGIEPAPDTNINLNIVSFRYC